MWIRVWLSSIVIVLGACTTPSDRIDAEAVGYGFDRQLVRGSGFDHVVYRSGRHDRSVRRLHIYLEGDGSPWRTRTDVSADPTPRDPVALALMGRDSKPAFYLGRPCYNGLAGAPDCNAALWTNRRYGPEVIDSMEAALSRLIAPTPDAALIFIGYSGGGTLAMLLAERFAQTGAVITIAGNLDINRWTEHHGYSPLVGSFDPAKRQPLPAKIAQIHYVGGRDTVVPSRLTRAFVKDQDGNAVLVEHDDFGHHCCWVSEWTAILGRRGL